ncbi:UbiA family prenyltransferase [Litoribacter alkaliphilus]|uniref:UbiA family prenyltransferase n=1 Tax=Litoribacter ruber TaxID=702568 RepID=A0AAP2CIB1_9BACT|nr:UbiA family prenyltransferase [Litoribacter alkaliphilus]MBS9524204.1 UbiA family prenyltransferase [Litoribacter alkaliphilus]
MFRKLDSNSLFRLLQWLSLDVVLGACAGMYFFAHLLGLHLDLLFYLLMGLAVWSIYTLDHLLDARQVGGTASTERHRFHQVYSNQLCIVLGVVVIVGAGIAYYLLDVSLISVSAILLGGLIVGNMLAIKYLFSKLAFLKEFNIAVFYTVGIMLVPYLLGMDEGVNRAFWLLGLAYFLVALMNLWLLSIMDAESDRQDGFVSLVTFLGKERVQKLLFWLMIITLIYNLSLYWILFSYFYMHISVILITSLIHCLEVIKPSPDSSQARRKMEAAFMLPFILLLF